MTKINLLKDQQYRLWDQDNKRFHYRLQLACLLMIAFMFVLLSIYG